MQVGASLHLSGTRVEVKLKLGYRGGAEIWVGTGCDHERQQMVAEAS